MKNQMPHNFEVEKAFLAGLLHNNDLLHKIENALSSESFFDIRNQNIFAAICEIVNKGNTADIITLEEFFKAKKKNYGGLGYLSEILSTFTSSAQLQQYSRILIEKEIARKQLTLHSKKSQEISEGSEDPFSSLESSITELQKIFALNKSHIVLTPKVYANDFKAWFYEQTFGDDTSVPSGFEELDDKIGGFVPGEFTVIAARPSHGKTAFALSAMNNQSIMPSSGEPISTGLISIEMNFKQLLLRLAAIQTRVPLAKFRKPSKLHSDQEKLKIVEAANTFADGIMSLGNMFLQSQSGVTEYDIHSLARRMVEQHGIKILYVDYLQLIVPSLKSANRERQIANISQVLTLTAKELDIPVVALAQLNRMNETEKRAPRTSDLRDSGAIEQDADVIILLDRPEMRGVDKYHLKGNERDSKNRIIIDVAKNRQGATGKFDALFAKDYAHVMEDNDYRWSANARRDDVDF